MNSGAARSYTKPKKPGKKNGGEPSTVGLPRSECGGSEGVRCQQSVVSGAARARGLWEGAGVGSLAEEDAEAPRCPRRRHAGRAVRRAP